MDLLLAHAASTSVSNPASPHPRPTPAETLLPGTPFALRLTRRRFVGSSLAAAAALQVPPRLFATTPAACTVLPEQEIGPFYVASELLRSSIAEDHPGIPLNLHIALVDSRTCKPLANAAVDLWHCNAAGLYSGFTKTSLGPGGPGGPDRDGDRDHPHGPPAEGFGPPPAGFGPPPGGPHGGRPPGMAPSDKLTFCRGIQISDANGAVAFSTIFPGFYQGRVNHIHLKVRLGGHAQQRGYPQQRTYAAGHTAHTGQIFFPEDLAVSLMQQEPYRSHSIHRTTAAEDGIFTGQGGSLSVAVLEPVVKGYHATVSISVDPAATPAPVGIGGGGRGGPLPQR